MGFSLVIPVVDLYWCFLKFHFVVVEINCKYFILRTIVLSICSLGSYFTTVEPQQDYRSLKNRGISWHALQFCKQL